MLKFVLCGKPRTMEQLLKYKEKGKRMNGFANEDYRSDNWVWSARLAADYQLVDCHYQMNFSDDKWNDGHVGRMAEKRIDELNAFFKARLYPFRAERVELRSIERDGNTAKITVRIFSDMDEWHDADFDNARNLEQAAVYVAAKMLSSHKEYFPRLIGSNSYGWKRVDNDIIVDMEDEFIDQ